MNSKNNLSSSAEKSKSKKISMKDVAALAAVTSIAFVANKCVTEVLLQDNPSDRLHISEDDPEFYTSAFARNVARVHNYITPFDLLVDNAMCNVGADILWDSYSPENNEKTLRLLYPVTKACKNVDYYYFFANSDPKPSSERTVLGYKCAKIQELAEFVIKHEYSKVPYLWSPEGQMMAKNIRLQREDLLHREKFRNGFATFCSF